VSIHHTIPYFLSLAGCIPKLRVFDRMADFGPGCIAMTQGHRWYFIANFLPKCNIFHRILSALGFEWSARKETFPAEYAVC
jgi:hypothetical protein